MKIVLSGVETTNKGAELMLYAILQEIERKHPEATVYISGYRVNQGLNYIDTPLNIRFFPLEKFWDRSHINGVLIRMGLPKIESMNFVHADYFFDGSGFIFSDQCGLWGSTPEWWERILKNQYKKGSKIIFLPQAFGPLEMKKTREAIKILNKYATVIMPREQVSLNYLKSSGIVDMSKVKMYSDFTCLVEGRFPKKYEHLQNGICIIPNVRMVDRGVITMDKYKELIREIILKGKLSGHTVYLLNHEGASDEKIAYMLSDMLNNEIEVVTGLNALEVKGLIASAYLVVSSRFHGVASSLNSCVPCLATSWSHKYQELFNDYGIEGNVLPLNDLNAALIKVEELIDKNNNTAERNKLSIIVPKVKEETKAMWKMIWDK